MASTDKSKPKTSDSETEKSWAEENHRSAEVGSLTVRRPKKLASTMAFPRAGVELADRASESPQAASYPDRAEVSMLHDIDAILSRIEAGIAKERKAMDDLVERIRQPAA